ncbi:MAG: cytochrome b [Rickettsiaceae bacterium]|nr:cytochrome b [Rickettsiaceae bacterium]
MFNTKNSYGLIAKLFHWVTALIVISMICVGYYMTSLDSGADKVYIYKMHKASGVLLLIIILTRLIWNSLNVRVESSKSAPYWQVAAAKLNFKVLYLMSLLMPITGISMSLYHGKAIDFFSIWTIEAFTPNKSIADLAKEMHSGFVVLLIISITLHILGALYHHFILKDRTLIRMIKK